MVCWGHAGRGSPAGKGEQFQVKCCSRELLLAAVAAFIWVSAAAAAPKWERVWDRHMTAGQFLYEEGRYDAAAQQLKIALATARKFGPRDIRLPSTLNRLAQVYHDQGKYSQAEPLYKRSLTLTRRILGPNDPDVAANLNNLATLYRDEGRYAPAEALYKQSLEIVEKTQGPDNPDVAVSLNNLAELYGEEGKYGRAVPLYQRSLAIWEKALGPDDLNVAVSLNNLGALYGDQKEYAQAEELYQRSLAIKEKSLGPSDPSVALTLSNLGQVYVAEGKFDQAEPVLYRSLTILRWPLEESSNPVVGRALTHLGTFYRDRGNYILGEYYYQRSLKYTRKVEGADSPDLAKTLRAYATLLRLTHRPVQAAKMEAQATAIASRPRLAARASSRRARHLSDHPRHARLGP